MISISEILENLSHIASRNEKISYLKDRIFEATEEEADNLCGTFYLALNPLICFGFKSIPFFKESEFSHVHPFREILNRLSALSKLNHSKASEDWLAETLRCTETNERETVKRIVLKDLRCGVQIATWNEVVKDTEWINYHVNDYPCMLASTMTEKRVSKLPWEHGVYAQLKCDGMRFNAVVERHDVKFFGRSGKPITILSEELKNEFIRAAIYEPCVFDGELLVATEDGTGICDRKTGNGILNKAVRGTITTTESERVRCVLWDMIPLESFKVGYCPMPYATRFEQLSECLETLEKDSPLSLVESNVVYSMEEAQKVYESYVSKGLEGVILKNPDNEWRDTRATDQIKMKEELDADLRIVEVVEGTGKYKGMMGALVLESDDHKIKVSVGTGFSDAQRKEYFTNDILDKVVTVTYNMRIKDKNREGVDSLFLPRFIEIREDKDCTNMDSEIK